MYKEEDFKELPKDFFKFRSIDVLSHDGRYIRVKELVRDSEHLTFVLNCYKPKSVWFQSCKFLNPQTQKGKSKSKRAGYDFSDNLFLWKDIHVIDIDKEVTKVQIFKLITSMENKGFKFWYWLRSNGKKDGIQIAFKTPSYFRFKYKAPSKRKETTYNKLRELYFELLNNGFDFLDEVAFINPLQVFKLPGSYCNGKQCVPILVREFTPYDKYPSVELKGSDIGSKQGERPRISSLLISRNISSRVIGTRDEHVLLFDFKELPKIELDELLRDLIKTFNLSDMYIFSTGKERWHVYCLKLHSFDRLLKIYKYVSQWDFHNLLLRQGELYLRISPKYNDFGELIKIKPIFSHIIKSSFKFKMSKGHYNYLRQFILIEEDKFAGKNELNTRVMKREQEIEVALND